MRKESVILTNAILSQRKFRILARVCPVLCFPGLAGPSSLPDGGGDKVRNWYFPLCTPCN